MVIGFSSSISTVSLLPPVLATLLHPELEKIKKAQAESARTFESGWTKAMNQFVDDATNAALQAENIFKKATQGMEDAIVNFAKTGKFEWKSFVSSIVEELLRQQVRQLIANTFSGLNFGGSSGGTFGNNNAGMGNTGLLGLGGLFGFLASGGPANANTPYIVGEQGPELFVPRTAGTVVPNHQLNSAAATGTNITYNIQAVDAMSFKQMLAQDPTFLHAVAEQGRRSLPGSR